MLRRRAVSVLLGAWAGLDAQVSGNLKSLLDPSRGSAVLIDVRNRRLLATNSAVLAGSARMTPGSTVKPFVLAALLKRGRMRPETSFLCPGRLTIGTRRFDCTHPPLVVPMRPDTALAYSCNGFVAHAAEQFRPNELASEFEALGFASRTGLLGAGEVVGSVAPAATSDAIRLQSLGEAGILTTPLELALAYRQLALKLSAPEIQPILAGLEGAVEFGTAQQARVKGTTVAGKTGSTRSGAGESIAWFAGFMPSRTPEVVVTVMLSGRSGGSDAAPVAAQILEAYRSGRL
jgi:cell division protein FtsI/penicillin-binding protein 2